LPYCELEEPEIPRISLLFSISFVFFEVPYSIV